MISVMIVDDEYLVRERVKRCVRWKDLGFEITGEAANAQEAFVMMKNGSPNILITDISMPYINGLDFSKTVKENHPYCKVVVLTGYSSFDYARTALNVGVSYYLMKPINKKELTDVVLTLKEQIESEERVRSYMDRLPGGSKAADVILREKTLDTILSSREGDLNARTRDQFSSCFQLLKDSGLVVLLVEMHFDSKRDMGNEDRELWYFAIDNIMSEVFCGFAPVESVNDREKRMTVMLNVTSSEDVPRVARLCSEVQQYVLKHLSLPVTVGVSGFHSGLEGLAIAYTEASEALRSKLVFGSGKTVRFDLLKRQPSAMGNELDLRDTMLIHLRLGKLNLLRDRIHGIFERITALQEPVETLYMVLSELLLSLSAFAKEKGIELTDAAGRPVSLNGFLEGKNDMAEIERGFWEMAEKLTKQYNNEHLLGYAGLVVRAKRFIDENYENKNINLDTIAANIAVNPCHLSTVFKKESGFSIIEYLTQCRMSNAKNMMDEGGYRITDVAEAVGYGDPYYFSKCFKKAYGVSPSHYMKSR